MSTTARLATIGGAALAVTISFAGPAAASPLHSADHGHRHRGAVFVQTDNPGGNSVVAYDRSGNGTLHRAGVYRTGGNGGALTGSVVDHLASQGSLTADPAHHMLYAVNAGSNTITSFTIRGDELQRRQTVSSGGSFPVSIAAHRNAVYVLNARGGGSIQGYLRLGTTLIRVPAWHRNLGLDPTMTPEFTSTPGQVAFSPDGSRLIVTTKANGSQIDVFNVDIFGGVSTHPTVNPEPGAVPFAVTYDRAGHLVVAQAGPSAVSTFTVRRDNTLVPIDSEATGQAATCWIVRSGSYVYASNAGSASLSGYRIGRDGNASPLGNTATGAGTVDAAVSPDGNYLYVQTGAAGGVDAFRIHSDGSLSAVGSVLVPGAVGGEGIVVT